MSSSIMTQHSIASKTSINKKFPVLAQGLQFATKNTSHGRFHSKIFAELLPVVTCLLSSGVRAMVYITKMHQNMPVLHRKI